MEIHASDLMADCSAAASAEGVNNGIPNPLEDMECVVCPSDLPAEPEILRWIRELLAP